MHIIPTRSSGWLFGVFLFVFCAGALQVIPDRLVAQDIKTSFTEFKEPSPTLHSAHKKAESLAEKKLYTAAKQHLESYAAAHPQEKHPLLFYEIGYFSHHAGELTSAVANLEKAVELAPDFREGWQLLALSHQKLAEQYAKDSKEERNLRYKALQKGARAMERAAQLSGDNTLLYQSALLWLEGERPQQALVILKNLRDSAAPQPEWLVALSDTLKALKRHEETAETMEKAARIQNNPDLLFHAAWLWVELGKSKRALPLLEILTKKKNPDKNWLLLLVSTYNNLKQTEKAALTLERVIEIDPVAEYLYNCGLLWLQDEKPDRALRSLVRLSDMQPPKADWFVATAQAWLLKEVLEKAADAMERGAGLSGKSEHIYQAGVLRLQLKQADRAIGLLTPLEKRPQPESKWMVALANSWLLKKHYLNGARYMERAAVISDDGKLYHRAGMLWRLENRLDKTVSLLKKSVARKNVEQLWLLDLATALMDTSRSDEVLPVMKRTNLEDKNLSCQLRYRGAVIWLSIAQPARAYPILQALSDEKSPSYSWLSSLVKVSVELEKQAEASKTLRKTLDTFPEKVECWKLAVWFALQQGDYTKAAAAKEVVRQFEPADKKHLEDLSRLYLLAGVPAESAKAYIQVIGSKPTSEQLAHLLDIYLSGQMYKEALQPAQQLLKTGSEPAKHWASLGDIHYALGQYEKSAEAYKNSADLTEDPKILMRAAYAEMKIGQLQQASKTFQKAIDKSNGEETLVDTAMQNLDYIKLKKESMQRLN